jgi:hypothetical protein
MAHFSRMMFASFCLMASSPLAEGFFDLPQEMSGWLKVSIKQEWKNGILMTDHNQIATPIINGGDKIFRSQIDCQNSLLDALCSGNSDTGDVNCSIVNVDNKLVLRTEYSGLNSRGNMVVEFMSCNQIKVRQEDLTKVLF